MDGAGNTTLKDRWQLRAFDKMYQQFLLRYPSPVAFAKAIMATSDDVAYRALCRDPECINKWAGLAPGNIIKAS